MNKYLVGFFILLTFFKAEAQTTEVIPVPPRKPLMTVDLGFDYLKLFSLAFPQEKKYEGIAALNFGFGLSADGEYGYTKKSPDYIYKNGTFTFEGSYYRIGLSYNYQIGENNLIGIGVRYGASTFNDVTSYTIKSKYFNDYDTAYSRNNSKAQWAELVLKTEGGIKKIKNVKLGMFIRIKFLDPIEQDNYYANFPVRGIPGYGLANTNTTAAINLYIKYSIPLIR